MRNSAGKLYRFTRKRWAEILGFVLLVGVSNTYGPLLFARAMGNTERYNIGAECSTDRYTCAETYFPKLNEELNKALYSTASEIAERVVRQSRASYSGNCPCPYDSDRRGYSCGGRSAYSRWGGAEPYCYVHDVSSDVIEIEGEEYIEEAERRLNVQIDEHVDVYTNKAPVVLAATGYFVYLSKRRSKVSPLVLPKNTGGGS